MSAPVAKGAHKRLLAERSASFSPADRLNSALILRNSGDLSAAFRICRSVLQESKGCADAWHLLGVLTLDGGDPKTAAMYFLRALKLNPRKPQYYNSLAVSMIDLHRFQQAETTLMQAAALFPPHADILCNLGRIRMVQERFAEALDLFRKALKIAPDHAVSIANTAVIDQSCGRERRAVEAYRHALRIDPHKPIWWSNMGAAFMKLSEYVSAADCFHNALKCAPDHLPALSGLSMAQRAQGAMEQSAATSRRILLSHPQNPEATANLAYVYQQTADWVRFEAILPKLSRQTASALRHDAVPAEAPFFNLGRTGDPDLNLAVSMAWSRSIAGRVRRTAKIFAHATRRRSPDGRITLGYLSSDFRNHVIAYQAAALFELHNRKHFRVCGFSTGPVDGSAYRRRISASFDTFCDLREADAAGAAQTIYEQKVDILIDLTGHTEYGRQDICALRPAPLQISYLGFLSSSGADYIDYLIGDPIVTPPEHARFYTEKLIRLPHCYQIISPAPPFPRPVTRAESGLPEHAFVFCCFNQAYKIDARLFDCWMQILRKVPRGVLWLYRSNESAERNLRRAAAESGIARERIIFADKRPFAEHMQRARLADLALDPTRYNGGATTANMLCAGVPVVTINGNHFVSRMSASHLIAAGLGELVASDPDRYIQLAVDLAVSPERLSRLRRLLSSNLKTSPLCDTPRWVKHLEQAYEEAWERHCRGQAPDHIDVRCIEQDHSLSGPMRVNHVNSFKGAAEELPHPVVTSRNAFGTVLQESRQLLDAKAQGERLLLSKDYEQAFAQFQRALEHAPEDGDTCFCLGLAAQGMGDKKRALTYFRKAGQLLPEWPAAHFNLGVILLQDNQYLAAIDVLEKVISLQPGWSQAWSNLGNALDGAGLPERALECWHHATALDPANAHAHHNRGIHWQKKGEFDRASEAYRKALYCSSEMTSAHFNLGLCLQENGRLQDALIEYRRAADHDPNQPGIWFKQAEVDMSLGHTDEAIANLQQSIRLNGENHAAHHNLANALLRKGRIEEALDHCQRALYIKANFEEAKVLLFEIAMQACDWTLMSNLEVELDRLCETQLKKKIKVAESPFLSLQRHCDPVMNRRVAENWSHEVVRKVGLLKNRPTFRHTGRSSNDIIRVGYLSGDFKDHAVAYQIGGLLAAHDRSRFKIFGYACNPDNGTFYRKKLLELCDCFTSIEGMNDAEAAQLIFNDRIDILVDLSGHTHGNRMGVLALRPAPVQAAYLGFLGTTGADFIDYFITDAVVTPPDQSRFYTEQMVYLPACYQANDDTLPISDKTITRTEAGLPEDQVVLCSFNQPYKISRPTFNIWMQILKNVSKSVLWLLDHNQMSRQNLCRHAADCGIDPNRLIFSGTLRIDLHLRRLQLADLILDTFTYNGGATTANALWAGVPLITLMGKHFVSRMSASALSAAGLLELITYTPEEYCSKATELALDKKKRDEIRSRLTHAKRHSPLFNTCLFAHHIESAYETMHCRFRRGLRPASFAVSPIKTASSLQPKTVQWPKQVDRKGISQA